MPGKYLPGHYRDTAREAFKGDDDIDIEECATALVAEEGAWVAARVWICDSDVEAWRREKEPDAERGFDAKEEARKVPIQDGQGGAKWTRS